ncbi:SDR family oxidoreductase [Kineosporia sp. R_H_3]|uniref:SDR family NAD(P)-dependent oxidoreductase n=1 Tax=Kineosporia sp. R_H_3 TaxID=1961848 RepID=UPI000B4B2ACC|nr:SDR family NAD(P)-dependent oxidoreductase [Kineosporia sp. R_H_3]
MTSAGPSVVLVTGASGGIGSAVSLAYARSGARLVLLARSPDDLDRLARRCLEAGAAGAVPVVADVADGGAVREAVRDVVAEHGRVDVTVHCAAVVAYGRFGDVPAEVWDRTVTVGVLGTANVARAVLPTLAAQHGGGSLVVVGSLLGEVTVPFMSSYVTGKWAVRGLTRVLQQEARATPGVHVALVAPGSVDTAIYELAGSYAGRQGRPPPPVYGPERVAEAVLRVVAGRRRSAFVGVTNPLVRLGFVTVPRLYDVLVTPLMRMAGLGRDQVDPHAGNVLRPSQEVRTP